MVLCAITPALGRLKQNDHKVEDSLDYIVGTCLERMQGDKQEM